MTDPFIPRLAFTFKSEPEYKEPPKGEMPCVSCVFEKLQPTEAPCTRCVDDRLRNAGPTQWTSKHTHKIVSGVPFKRGWFDTPYPFQVKTGRVIKNDTADLTKLFDYLGVKPASVGKTQLAFDPAKIAELLELPYDAMSADYRAIEQRILARIIADIEKGKEKTMPKFTKRLGAGFIYETGSGKKYDANIVYDNYIAEVGGKPRLLFVYSTDGVDLATMTCDYDGKISGRQALYDKPVRKTIREKLFFAYGSPVSGALNNVVNCDVTFEGDTVVDVKLVK